MENTENTEIERNGTAAGTGETPARDTLPAAPQEDGTRPEDGGPRPRIGREEIAEARRRLLIYKQGKAMLDRKIVENDAWYRLRHWAAMRDRKDEIEPTSGWLLNCILSKHADAMDSFPHANVLPREEADRAEAELLSAILPVIFDRCGFEATYSDEQMYKMKTGCGCFGVTWDPEAENGIGDVTVTKVDLLNLYWEPGITDIQQSRDLFCVTLTDADRLKEEYPALRDRIPVGETVGTAKYLYDDTVDTAGKVEVVDWYYKKRAGRRTVLHYARFVGDTVLYATENDRAPRRSADGGEAPPLNEAGLYDHGKYPFVFDVLFPIEGTPAGFGYIDIGKDAQAYVDRGNQALMRNLLTSARPRYFIRADGSVREEEFADLKNDFIHVDGSLGQDSVVPVTQYPLPAIYAQLMNAKVDELKETTGNRDVSNGGTSGVTAASAIAALQEASSKLSRTSNKGAFRAFKQVCELVIELIRQFYSFPRAFRVTGAAGKERFFLYTNERLKNRAIEAALGVGGGVRHPTFDLEITAEKASPYSRMSRNELALQLYTAGFFEPSRASQALACLDMMDFDRKEQVVRRVTESAADAGAERAALERIASVRSGEARNGTRPQSLPASAKESPTTSSARRRAAGEGDV